LDNLRVIELQEDGSIWKIEYLEVKSASSD
jgi:hypothetical protein